MNRSILLPRRNPKTMTKIARIIGKYRYYRYLGIGVCDSMVMAWRVVK